MADNMAKAPQFPFFVRDWLCSRRVLAMSGEAVKAYLYLLAESWLHVPRATLPNDDKILSEMARVNSDVWIRIKHEILQHFVEGKCKEHKGLLYNDTLLEKSRNYEKNQRPNNKNAKKTRIKHEMNTTTDNDIDIDNGINSLELKGECKGEKEPEYKNDNEKEIVQEFIKYRKDIKKPFKSTKSIELLLKHLRELGNNNIETMRKITEQSIANGWQGIFELKETQTHQPKYDGRPIFNNLKPRDTE